MLTIPTEYSISVLMQYAGYPEKTHNGYRASCPICKEGKNWGKKKRLYFFENDNYFYCHNCSRAFTPFYWIKETTGKTYSEIKEDLLLSYNEDDLFLEKVNLIDNNNVFLTTPDLPEDSINLLDTSQTNFFTNNYFVKLSLEFLKNRNLLNAKFIPKAFYISLTDYIHKNRLIIPFYDNNGKITFYQSRALTSKQELRAKYLSKVNSNKYIFNLPLINFNQDYIFLMEGSIDACFIQNGLAISGISLTSYQDELLQFTCPFMKRVWLFDNPKIDNAGKEKMIEYAMHSNDLFFTWSDQFEEYKDLNEFCVQKNIRSVNPDEILKRSFIGSKALLKL